MIYLLHFERPYPNGKRPQHYLGHTEDHKFDVRMREHANGSNKARFTQVMAQIGIPFEVARTWPGDFALEIELKKRHRPAALCPICRSTNERNTPVSGFRQMRDGIDYDSSEQ